jgi:Tol biopolymer transport system component
VSRTLDIAAFKAWSPVGDRIAATAGVDLVLVDVTNQVPKSVTVTKPTVARPSVGDVRFSPNGKALAFIGAQSRTTSDLYYASLDSLDAPRRITGPIVDSPGASSFAFWSPDGRWLGFYTKSLEPVCAAVDVANGEPGVPFALKVQSYSPLSWLPKTPNTFVAFSSGNPGAFVTYDLSTPNVDPIEVLLAASPVHDLNPVRDVLAADDIDAVAIRDLHAPPPPADVRVDLANSTNQLRWSPDGRFLSIIAQDRGYRPEIIHMAGSTPSKPLALTDASAANIISLWQPVFR